MFAPEQLFSACPFELTHLETFNFLLCTFPLGTITWIHVQQKFET